MRELIKKILLEQLEGGEGGNPLSRKEIILFKYLNKNKKNAGTQKELLNLVKNMMSFIGRPESDSKFYYEVYTANFRPDGDYENLDKYTFRDFKQFKQRKIPNNGAYEYTAAKIPFKGSNLEGYWDVNGKNEWYYVVVSYGWYPLFLFINNMWYRVMDSYSSSTAKQISHSNPVRYNSGLKADVMSVTPSEMKSLIAGKDVSDIKTSRVSNFTANNEVKNKLIGLKKLVSGGWGENAHRVSFTVDNINEVGGKIKINIKINKAGKMVDRKMVVDTNLKDNPELLRDIESTIKKEMLRTYPNYLTDDNTEIELKY
jgi:hypothetical protein